LQSNHIDLLTTVRGLTTEQATELMKKRDEINKNRNIKQTLSSGNKKKNKFNIIEELNTENN
jgi:hypothetical protein